ncbi:hypothetical protein V8C42DRAFT_335577 [Trichoderma barbatum]
MEDQFGGRTDDDLFYDDFEPVESEAVLVQEEQYFQPEPEPVPVPVPASIPAPVPAAAPAAPAPAPAPPQQVAPQPVPAPKQTQSPPSSKPSPAPAAAKSKKPPQPSKGLSSSRFADKPAPKPSPAPAKAPTPAPKPAPAPAAAEVPVQAPEEEPEQSPPPTATTGTKEKLQRSAPSQNTAVSAEIRAKSGSNPRQKLTEDELAAKMEKMKLLSAEKARKFEMAEQDEKQHAAAYARGMEEARKRRAEDAERRKRGEDERRKLEDERAKNRERKLKAMNIKDGSWDEGKEALAEEEARRGFRGANGGIRGAKTRGGLGGSRFARDDESPDVDRFLDDRHRGGRGRGDRGRGANGNGRGRGRGRGSYDGPVGDSRPAKQQQIPAADDFPSLPSDNAKAKADAEQNNDASAKPTMAQAAAAPPPPLPIVLGGGKWDDEMEALDELNQAQS